MSKLFQEEVLTIDESVLNDRIHKGLTWYIPELTETMMKQVIDSCLLMQKQIGEIKKTRYGDILLDKPTAVHIDWLLLATPELHSLLPAS